MPERQRVECCLLSVLMEKAFVLSRAALLLLGIHPSFIFPEDAFLVILSLSEV